MVSAWPLVVGAIALERLVELVVARRNERWLRARGAHEAGRGHHPFLVALHAGWLAGTLAEPWLLDRAFVARGAAAALGLLVLAQALRWWCVLSLGRRWTTRVLVLPGAPLVARGPYRWLRHPNYVAVVVEGLALPLAHGAWITAASFTVLNAALLARRVAVEERALGLSPRRRGARAAR